MSKIIIHARVEKKTKTKPKGLPGYGASRMTQVFPLRRKSPVRTRESRASKAIYGGAKPQQH